MERPRRLMSVIAVILAAAFIISGTLPSAADGATPGKSAIKKTAAPLDIHSFHVGMTVKEVKRLLQKRKIKGYETGYSDLFVYPASPDAEMRLSFSCGAKGYLLSKVELTASFSADDAEAAVSRYKEKLVAKYGMPSITESQPDRFDFCWGRCDPGSTGTKLEAGTIDVKERNRRLRLSLSKDSLKLACDELRQKKTRAWLVEWIAAVQKFNTGMSLKEASTAYAARYKEKPAVDEEVDKDGQDFAAIGYVIADTEYFSALDPDSQYFEGKGPGKIILKFTGDQGAARDKINRRLYHSYFSTTEFTDKRLYGDLQKKLALFVKKYGQPVNLVRNADSIIATWTEGDRIVRLELFDSGLMTFEQRDDSLKLRYRESALRQANESRQKGLEKNIF